MPFPIKDKANQEITLKGFLYFVEESYFLCDYPEVKSCCIPNLDQTSIVLLEGSFDGISSYKAITVRGLLEVNPSHQWQYQLKNATIVKENLSYCYLIWFPIALILFFSLKKHCLSKKR